jgi:DNA-binding response OmpR family regulator
VTDGGLLVFPTPDPDLARLLDLGGWAWSAVADDLTARNAEGAPAGALVRLGADEAAESAEDDPAWQVLEAFARREPPLLATLVLLRGTHLDQLAGRSHLFADFCLTPFHPREMEARIAHLLAAGQRAGGAEAEPPVDDQTVRYGPLLLNTETYQARIAQRALDLTYMEYELLRYLAQNPDRVHTREVLLSQVWGYEYYGGARTVDVHIRRLRSKLGEEHARMIQTVRSVGYRFGRADD